MFRFPPICAFALVTLSLAVRPALSDDKVATEKKFANSRTNWITEACDKTKPSIVSIKVPRPSGTDTVGSGVIIDERGYIVTNKHVVANSSQVKVRLADGSNHVADVIWGEAAYDLAVVRIKTSRKLQRLELAPVADLKVGEYVIAVGHPYGYEYTISMGIIGGLGRSIPMPSGDTLVGMIQTSAPINPGNSGGPLLNVNGELIGITTALRDGAQNIAFAINAGTVKQVLSRNLSALKLAGIQHGLQVQEKILAEVGDDRQRVIVTGADGAAKGVVKGDEILAVGNCHVANAFDIERALWDVQAGEQINLKVVRQGKELIVPLVLGGSQGAGAVASVNSTSRVPVITNDSVPVADSQR